MAEKKEPTYYENVYDVVRSIPSGRVTTYGRIADFLTLGSARMVGWALKQALHRGDVPAHRPGNSRHPVGNTPEKIGVAAGHGQRRAAKHQAGAVENPG